ncbi:helix-turn-helix domain-containing protein [Mucilaginibacter achroorhodeus]|uniref:Helix-turn-helix domain-containing protein n=1 Tax=Mucilaginibacter achroorhodeus TaxID=2599294 RepID=A0A563U8G1_9SPHI|nr:AraC family transcriptional regulator [Mucilaginibacter achroorhodeus]TWR27647.1 helix-turn-helix domain-containing protein [Mucilaginibacter achroorhodeus]
MKTLKTGEFYGQTNQTLHLDFATITDTEYTHDSVDWHYHENAYFTFILQGNVIEGNKKEVYTCTPGTLLFHNWQDPHYNIKPKGYTRGFQIEINNHWLSQADIDIQNLQGSFSIDNPQVKLLFYQLFKESKANDDASIPATEALLLQVLAGMESNAATGSRNRPDWVKQVKEAIADDISRKFTLKEMAVVANVHPAHLSRDFSKYFNTNLGEYIRMMRIEKALSLMHSRKLSLTEIAMQCGFADQSHFLRCFKVLNADKPKVYRAVLASG